MVEHWDYTFINWVYSSSITTIDYGFPPRLSPIPIHGTVASPQQEEWSETRQVLREMTRRKLTPDDRHQNDKNVVGKSPWQALHADKSHCPGELTNDDRGRIRNIDYDIT